MNDPEGFDGLSPEERVILLEALRDHIKKLGPAARSNDEVANTVRLFQALAQKLEAILEPNTRSPRPSLNLASASHKRGHNRPSKGRSGTKKLKGKSPAEVNLLNLLLELIAATGVR